MFKCFLSNYFSYFFHGVLNSSPFIKAHPLSFQLCVIHPVIQRVVIAYNLGGVKCQPSLKCRGYYAAHFTPLNLADWLESFPSHFVLYFFKQFQFRRHTLAFQFTNFVDKPKFSYR